MWSLFHRFQGIYHQFVEFAGIGPSPGLLHCLPHEEVERPFLPGLEILDGLGVLSDDLFYRRKEGAVIAGGLCEVEPFYN